MRLTKTTCWLMTITLLLSMGAGCVSEGESGGERWGICDGCEDSLSPQIVDRSEERIGERHEVSPSLNELEPCAPQAVEEARLGNAPELPVDAANGECSLEQQAYDYDGDGEADRVTRWRQDGEVIEKVVEDRGRLLQEVAFEVDASGDVRRVLQRNHHLYYGTGYTEQEWTFDDRGRLTSQTQLTWGEDDGVETLQSAYEISQTWRNGRLVARTEDSSYRDSDRREKFEWRYDGGRLVEAVVDQSPSEPSQRTVWTYDDGRPVAVERSMEGVTLVRHGWEYHDDGVVASHHVEYGSHGLGENAAEFDARSGRIVDTYHAPNPHVLYSPYVATQNPWQRANPQVDAQRGCYTLPSSVGHGYPPDELVYQLGWGEEPQEGIHWASGYASHGYGYAYGYGQHLWYGHTGVGTPWAAGQHGATGVTTSNKRYDRQGRMIGETLTHRPYADVDTTNPHVDQRPMSVERRRRFSDDALLKDDITVRSGEEVHERTLLFERSADGGVLQRELWQNDNLLEFQTWDRDAQGRITEHEVHVAQRVQQYPLTLLNLLREEVEEPVHTASYERRFDEHGRVEFVAGEELLPISQRTEFTTIHGEHGPLQETRTYSSEHGESASRTSHEYDASGRKIAERHDHEDDGEVDTMSRYVYEDDQLVEVLETYGDTTRVTSMSYVCQ